VVTLRHTLRFIVTTAVTGTVTSINGGGVCGALGGICTAANSAVTCYSSSFRIHRVSIWPSAVAVGTISPCPEIVWYSPSNAVEKDSSVERALPAGLTVSAPIHSRPPAKSLCGDWVNSVVNVTNLMFGLLNTPAGSVIDLDVSATMSNNMACLGVTVASGTLGNPYYLYLDGSTRHGIAPVGKPLTF